MIRFHWLKCNKKYNKKWSVRLPFYLWNAVTNNTAFSCFLPNIINCFVGGVGLVFFFVWILAVYEKPSVHPRISTDECKMIEAKQGEAAIIYDVFVIPRGVATGGGVYRYIHPQNQSTLKKIMWLFFCDLGQIRCSRVNINIILKFQLLVKTYTPPPNQIPGYAPGYTHWSCKRQWTSIIFSPSRI